jgi:hypothetical protein
LLKDVYTANTWQILWLGYLIICKSESSNLNFDKLLSQLKANMEDDNGVELFMQVIVNQVDQTLEA